MSSKLNAAKKIAKGSLDIVSGVMTATGKGILGAAAKEQHMMGTAARYGVLKVRRGRASISEGIEEWKRAAE